MRKLFVIIMLLILLDAGTTLTIGGHKIPAGATYTQEQLDGIDIDNIKFDYKYKGIQFPQGKNFALFNFDYNAPTKQDVGYLIETKKLRIRYEFWYWNECRDVNTVSVCKAIVKENVVNDIKKAKQNFLAILKSWQNPAAAPFEDDFDFDDLDE